LGVQLNQLFPDTDWDVKNQAAVHLWYERRFGYAVPPLHSVEDAVATWPEQQLPSPYGSCQTIVWTSSRRAG
jgi:hypothetical protein